jgi:hypothetical protein
VIHRATSSCRNRERMPANGELSVQRLHDLIHTPAIHWHGNDPAGDMYRRKHEFWDMILESETASTVPQLNLADLENEKKPAKQAVLEDDYGVARLPGFSRVRETISPRAARTWSRVESVKGEFVRKASEALTYSKELMRSHRNYARNKVCAAFRGKSEREREKEKLMELFHSAVNAGAVRVVTSEEPATW